MPCPPGTGTLLRSGEGGGGGEGEVGLWPHVMYEGGGYALVGAGDDFFGGGGESK